MSIWIIAAILLAALCGVLAACTAGLKNQLRQQQDEVRAQEDLRSELQTARHEELRRRRENAALHRALETERRYSAELEQALNLQTEQVAEAERLAGIAEKRRIAAEKDLSANQMKIRLLERQIDELEAGQLTQDQIYQELLRDHETAIAHLQDQQKRRASRRKPDVLDQQISLNDLLKGE